MTKEQYDTLLFAISSDLVRCIMSEMKMGSRSAMELLYNSKLYSMLEKEELKVWHFSTPTLMIYLRQELEKGVIEFDDV